MRNVVLGMATKKLKVGLCTNMNIYLKNKQMVVLILNPLKTPIFWPTSVRNEP